MALTVKTKNAKALLSAIKKAIDDKTIDTWTYDSDGDFTHSPEQWKNKAWFKPATILKPDELRFGLYGQNEINTTVLVYAVYHGRFAEMLLNHFDKDITEITTSSMPTFIDNITTGK